MPCCGPWGPSPCEGNCGAPGGPSVCGWGAPPWPIILAPPCSMEYIGWRKQKSRTDYFKSGGSLPRSIRLLLVNYLSKNEISCSLQTFCGDLNVIGGLNVLPVQGKVSWPWPAAGHIAVGCTEDRTEGKETLPVELQLRRLLAAWGELKCRGQSVKPLLNLIQVKTIKARMWKRCMALKGSGLWLRYWQDIILQAIFNILIENVFKKEQHYKTGIFTFGPRIFSLVHCRHVVLVYRLGLWDKNNVQHKRWLSYQTECDSFWSEC